MTMLANASPAERALGVDVSTFPGLDPTFQPITGPRVVSEALARRLMTPRGSLLGHPDYGIDVREYLHEGLSESRLYALKAAIVSEAEADPRVLSVTASLRFDPATGKLRIRVAGATASGPFDLVLSVSALTVEVLSR